MERKIGKRDVLLLAAVLIAALILWGGYRMLHRGRGAEIKITVNKEVYGIYSLSEDREIPITVDGNVTNTLVIEDRKADMIAADCPDLLCVHQKAISIPGETIVCLPNKVVVEVIGSSEKEAEFDTIAK